MGSKLIFQPGYTNHYKFVEVGVEDREKFDALQEWVPGVFSLFKNTTVELNPTEFSINVEIGLLKLCSGSSDCWVLVHSLVCPAVGCNLCVHFITLANGVANNSSLIYHV